MFRPAMLAAATLCMGVLACNDPFPVTVIEPQGPGLGNLAFAPSDAFRVIGRIDTSNGVPEASGVYPITLIKPFGTNTAYMHNGYLLTLFAPDSGKGPGGLLFYDVSDPRDPLLVNRVFEPEEGGRTAEFREAHAIGFSNVGEQQLAVLHTGRGVEFWDLSDVHSPERISRLELPGVQHGDYTEVAWQLAWQGPHVYVAGSNDGVYVVDARDPWSPVLADRGGLPNPIPPTELGGFRVGPLFAVGNLLVVTSMDTADGYAVLDISDPGQPLLMSVLPPFDSDYYATCLNGNRIYAAFRGGGAKMRTHDISDPFRITELHRQPTVDKQLYCATQDHYVFLGNEEHMTKVDVSNPATFTVVGQGDLQPAAAVASGIPEDIDHGQVTPFGNLVFVGNDHGTGSGFIVHQTDPDKTPPQVNMVSPADGATLQAATSRIGVTFTDNVEVHSVNGLTFKVRRRGGAQVRGRYAVQGSIVNFAPEQPLRPDTTYDIEIPAGGIVDWAGNPVAAAFSSSFTTAPDATVDAIAGLVGHWPLDDGYGTLVRETSGRGKNGLASGAVTLRDRSGAFGGDGAHVRVASPQVLATEGYTLTAWFRSADPGDGGDGWPQGGVIVDYAPPGVADGFGLALAAGKVVAYDHDSGLLLSAGSSLADGDWHHVAAVIGGGGPAQLYVDGELVREGVVVVPELGHKSDMLIGNSHSLGHGFAGGLRDLRVYARALEVEEVVAIAEARDQGNRLRAHIAAERSGGETVFSAYVAGPGEVLISWNFGDGSEWTVPSAATTVAHTYADPGHYQTIMRASNGHQTALASLRTTQVRQTESGRFDPAPQRSLTMIHAAEGDLLWLVNRDNQTLTAVDPASWQRVREVPAGGGPRSIAGGPSNTLWTADQLAGRVSIYDGSSGALLERIELGRGTRPFGIVYLEQAQRHLVSLEASGELVLLHSGQRKLLTRQQVGVSPRGLAASAVGGKVYATRFVSPDGGAQVYVSDIDLGQTAAPSPLLLLPDTRTVDGEDRARGLPNYLGTPSLSPHLDRLWVPAKKDNIYRGLVRDGQPLEQDKSVRAITRRLQLDGDLTAQVGEGLEIDHNDRALPVDVALSPEGDLAWVVLLASGVVELRDAYSGQLMSAIDRSGAGLQTAHLLNDGRTLLLHGYPDRHLHVYDVGEIMDGRSFNARFVTSVALVADEVLAPNVLAGKRIFFDARDLRMTRDGYISCAVCHLDGDQDGRVWDFTDRGEGLRNTIDLRGRAGTGHGPVHWSGNFDEIQDFEHDIRNAFGGIGFIESEDFAGESFGTPLGGKKAGHSPELDQLDAYVSSLTAVPQSPYRDDNGQLSASGALGQELFNAAGCETCHKLPRFTDSKLDLRHDVGTQQAHSGGRLGGTLDGIDTPTLRGIWETPPYLHDGSAATLLDVLVGRNVGDAHGATSQFGDGELEDLVRYLLEVE